MHLIKNIYHANQEIEAFSDEQKTLASAQLNQLKNSDAGTMGMFPLAGRVTNSFSMIFGMKIHDLENMEHSEHSESDDEDDSSSDDSFSSLGSDQDRGEVMFAGGLRYTQFVLLLYVFFASIWRVMQCILESLSQGYMRAW